MKLKKVLVMNGPNLDMLGTREPAVYGYDTLETLEETVIAYAAERGVKATCFQSNSEGKLINKLHKAPAKYDAIIYNPGAHTHYSYAIRDAIASIDTPVVEVHLSDIDSREGFRRVSVTAPVCVAQIKGMGIQGYCDAVDYLLDVSNPQRLGDADAEAASVEVADSVESPKASSEAQRQRRSSDAEDAEKASVEVADSVKELKASSEVEEGSEKTDAPAAIEGPVEPEGLPSLGELSAQRIARVREVCQQQGIDDFIARDNMNIYWMTAFDDIFDPDRAHALLVTPEGATMHTDSRYSTNCLDRVERIGSSVVIDDERKSHAVFARDIVKKEGEGRKLGIEDDITLAEYRKVVSELEGSGIQLVETTGLVNGLRAVKDVRELARMKAAQKITDDAFSHIIEFIKPGMTELQVKIELEDFMVRHGSQGVAFESIVACGANGASPHGQAGNRIIEEGHSVVMDYGAKAFGYNADMTRTVFIGTPSDEMRAAYETIRRANETVEATIKADVIGRDMHELAERILVEGGFGGKMGHGLGHGLGVDVHELPYLNATYDKPLEAGNVVTVEPGIYIAGKFGMRLEDFGVVTSEGYERFTQSTHEMVII